MSTPFDMMSPVALGFCIMMGISLAAVAGLRAFLPLCVVGWLAHENLLPLSSAYSWLGSDVAVLIFTVAAIIEVAADKIPVLDNVLDSVADWVKPVAGTILVSGFIEQWDPLWATIFGLLAGGSVASLFHQAKKITRLSSTGFTLGMGNPVISIIEDAASVLGILAGILITPLAFAFVCFVGWLIWRSGQRLWLLVRTRFSTLSSPAPS
ncbi:MAG: hypothetical protein GEEBNDBF_01174 [bacterium]|nr:hypothetical protein [bacterium]